MLKSSTAFKDSEVEFILLDLQDAFCHFGVHPAELKHCISPGLTNGTALLWVAMLFGFKGAPLIMGRLSAAIGRLLQSLFHPAEGQVQVYIDDVALMLRGSKELRDLQLAKVLYVLAAFGVQVAMEEGGTRLQGPMDRNDLRDTAAPGDHWDPKENARGSQGDAEQLGGERNDPYERG